jgi:hypothetical protein
MCVRHFLGVEHDGSRGVLTAASLRCPETLQTIGLASSLTLLKAYLRGYSPPSALECLLGALHHPTNPHTLWITCFESDKSSARNVGVRRACSFRKRRPIALLLWYTP